MAFGLTARNLHRLFQASLIAKGTLAATEGVSGLGLLLTPNAAIAQIVAWLAHYKMAVDPADKLAVMAQSAVAALPVQAQHFYALYLLAHGGIKLMMVLALARRLLWAYPISMAILAGFVSYQLHGFLNGGAPILALLTALDSLMIALVWREYRLLKSQTAP